MGSQRITLTLPLELLIRIDEAAKDNYCSRSDYLRESVILRLNKQQISPKPREIKQSEEEFMKELEEQYVQRRDRL